MYMWTFERSSRPINKSIFHVLGEMQCKSKYLSIMLIQILKKEYIYIYIYIDLFIYIHLYM